MSLVVQMILSHADALAAVSARGDHCLAQSVAQRAWSAEVTRSAIVTAV